MRHATGGGGGGGGAFYLSVIICIIYLSISHLFSVQKLRSNHHDKILACVYCEKTYVHRISEHLLSAHSNEKEVAKAAALPVDSRERRLAFNKIKNKGNLIHNIKVLGGAEGKVIVVRRSKSKDKVDDYLPCPSCYGFLKKYELWRHYQRACPEMPDTSTQSATNVQVQARLLLASMLLKPENEDSATLKPLLDTMHKDTIFRALHNDALILRFGAILLTKLGMKRKKDIAQRMRQLGRLKSELGVTEFDDIVKGKGFDKVVQATHQLCELKTTENKISVFKRPGLALRMGHNLKKISQIKYGVALRSDDTVAQTESETFQRLLENEWNDRVSAIAVATLAINKYENPKLEPITEDVVRLGNFVEDGIARLVPQLKETPTKEIWRELCEHVLVRVELLNFRRGGEIENILVSDYLKRGRSKQSMNTEIVKSLSDVEKQLLDRYLRLFLLICKIVICLFVVKVRYFGDRSHHPNGWRTMTKKRLVSTYLLKFLYFIFVSISVSDWISLNWSESRTRLYPCSWP